MEARETHLEKILEGKIQYVVPLFQRSYSWSAKKWKTLGDDLIILCNATENKEHFLGAIVYLPIEISPSGVNKYLIIDGQQRLTTLLLIFAAIRDLSIETDPDLSQEIHETYLTNKWGKEEDKFRILPSQPDREQFRNIIGRKNDLDSKCNIVKVYDYFKRWISINNLNPNELHSTLLRKISIVEIVLDREENPYLIYEGLNYKGEPLTPADLVRNYLLMQIDEKDQKIAYDDFWLPMENMLGDKLTNFIWRYLNKDGKSGKFVRLNSIYDEIKQKLKGSDTDRATDFLSDMHTFSKYYFRLVNPEMEENIEIQRRLKRLNRWEISIAYPFLLNVYHDYSIKKLSANEFCQIINSIESFVIRRFFCRFPTNKLNKIFIGLYQVIDKTDFVSSFQHELLHNKWPSDKIFLQEWTIFPIYQSGTGIPKCRHILESLESELTKNNEPVDVRYPKITIEHIMPQKLSKKWEETLGKEAINVHEKYLDTIGNLTLIGTNESMGNKDFNKKREYFSESNFALNKGLKDSIIWGKYTIEKRARYLGEHAIKIWPHPGGDNESDISETSKVDPTGSKPTGFYLFGTEYQVDTWRDMLLKVLSLLAEYHVEDFISCATKVKTDRRTHIALSLKGMNTPFPISGTNLFVEGNQSSRSVLWVIRQTMESCGDNPDDFEAMW